MGIGSLLTVFVLMTMNLQGTSKRLAVSVIQLPSNDIQVVAAFKYAVDYINERRTSGSCFGLALSPVLPSSIAITGSSLITSRISQSSRNSQSTSRNSQSRGNSRQSVISSLLKLELQDSSGVGFEVRITVNEPISNSRGQLFVVSPAVGEFMFHSSTPSFCEFASGMVGAVEYLASGSSLASRASVDLMQDLNGKEASSEFQLVSLVSSTIQVVEGIVLNMLLSIADANGDSFQVYALLYYSPEALVDKSAKPVVYLPLSKGMLSGSQLKGSKTGGSQTAIQDLLVEESGFIPSLTSQSVHGVKDHSWRSLWISASLDEILRREEKASQLDAATSSTKHRKVPRMFDLRDSDSDCVRILSSPVSTSTATSQGFCGNSLSKSISMLRQWISCMRGGKGLLKGLNSESPCTTNGGAPLKSEDTNDYIPWWSQACAGESLGQAGNPFLGSISRTGKSGFQVDTHSSTALVNVSPYSFFSTGDEQSLPTNSDNICVSLVSKGNMTGRALKRLHSPTPHDIKAELVNSNKPLVVLIPSSSLLGSDFSRIDIPSTALHAGLLIGYTETSWVVRYPWSSTFNEDGCVHIPQDTGKDVLNSFFTLSSKSLRQKLKTPKVIDLVYRHEAHGIDGPYPSQTMKLEISLSQAGRVRARLEKKRESFQLLVSEKESHDNKSKHDVEFDVRPHAGESLTLWIWIVDAAGRRSSQWGPSVVRIPNLSSTARN